MSATWPQSRATRPLRRNGLAPGRGDVAPTTTLGRAARLFPRELGRSGLSFCTMGVDESDHSTVAKSLLSQGSALVPNSSRKPQAYSISIASQPPAVVGQRGLAIQRLAFRALKNDPSPLNRSGDGRR